MVACCFQKNISDYIHEITYKKLRKNQIKKIILTFLPLLLLLLLFVLAVLTSKPENGDI